jgi:hypothetical protein
MLAVAMSDCRFGFSAGMNPILVRSVKRFRPTFGFKGSIRKHNAPKRYYL